MRTLKKAGIIILIVLLTIIPLCYGVIYFFSKDIKQFAVARINEQLNTKIKVADIELSILSDFPSVGLKFKEVVIFESGATDEVAFVELDQIVLGFSLKDVIDKNYTVSEITVANGQANLKTRADGSINFNIFKPDTGSSESLELKLENIEVDNVHFTYSDKAAAQEYAVDIMDAHLTGYFYEQNFDLSCKGELMVNHIDLQEINYLKNKTVDISAKLAVDASTNTYSFTEGDLKIGALLFGITGSFVNEDQSTAIDLDIEGQKMDIQSFLTLLPNAYQKSLEDFESQGKFYFNAAIKGEASESSTPDIRVDFGIDKGTIKKKDIDLPLEQVTCKGYYSNGSNHSLRTSYIEVSDLNAILQGQQLKASGRLNNFENPELKMDLAGKIDLEHFKTFADLQTVETLKGTVDAQMNFNGKLSDLESTATSANTKTRGTLQVSLDELQVKDMPSAYRNVSGFLFFRDNNLQISNLRGTYGDNDFSLLGTAYNFTPYLLLDSQQLSIETVFESKNLNLNDFLVEASNNTQQDSAHVFALPDRVSMNLNLKIDQLSFYEFQCQDLTGFIALNDGTISTKEVTFKAMEGDVKLSGVLSKEPNQDLQVTARAICKQINIEELFRQCSNFGQQELTDKHLKGVLDATIDFKSLWSPYLEVYPDKIFAIGDLTITNGEIIDYKPFLGLARFADVDDLKHLKFSTLKNTIDIKDRTINIPSFDIRSNAMNLNLSGSHTFDNYLDYHFLIKLSELLASKRPPRTSEFGEYEQEEEDGGTSLPLFMKGPIDDFKIGYDTKAARSIAKERLKKEKKTLWDLLRKEAGADQDKDLRQKKEDEDEVFMEDDLPD